jgi:hypothetical protein
MTRNAEPSTARNAVVLGNIVGFACVLTVAFIVAGRQHASATTVGTMRDRPGEDQGGDAVLR